mmetsp:Transcript_2518/g.7668  ORF Transcript_2518/g.7668 Transcript_2518/m.7668 type:complete len:221 (-) Transcript_2518:141-803(-)
MPSSLDPLLPLPPLEPRAAALENGLPAAVPSCCPLAVPRGTPTLKPARSALYTKLSATRSGASPSWLANRSSFAVSTTRVLGDASLCWHKYRRDSSEPITRCTTALAISDVRFISSSGPVVSCCAVASSELRESHGCAIKSCTVARSEAPKVKPMRTKSTNSGEKRTDVSYGAWYPSGPGYGTSVGIVNGHTRSNSFKSTWVTSIGHSPASASRSTRSNG